MRPAHSAREILGTADTGTAAEWGFNEARAFSAGNPGLAGGGLRPPSSFNEARAFSAGNLERDLIHCGPHHASMRPAHSAREIPYPTIAAARCARLQ